MINRIRNSSIIVGISILLCTIPFSQSKGQHILPAHQGSSYVPKKVITSRITQIDNTSAVGWVAISGALSNSSAKGVCWSSVNTLPTIANSTATYVGASLSFTVNLTGMTSNTTYYARAYCTFGPETIYGNVITFTTGNSGFVTDGKVNFVTMSTPGGVYSNDADQLRQQTDPGFGNSIASGTANIGVILDFVNRSTLNSAGINVTANGEYFSIVTSGFFVPSETGTYTFTCEGDDAVDLRVNGVIVASHYGGHAVGALGSHTGTISLTANVKYSFEARMQEYAGQEGLRVFWRKPSQPTGWFQHPTEVSSF